MTDSAKIIELLDKIGDKIIEEKEFLTELDKPIGDCDHGINMARGFGEVKKKLPGMADSDLGTIFKTTGMTLVSTVGGSAGPLYGTMIGGLSDPLSGSDAIDSEGLKAMLEGCLAAMEDNTPARTGDKTMMDALIPAVMAARDVEGGIPDILKAAADAAEQGAKDSEQYVSKYGRARSYKEQTIGTPDAGAVSTSLYFRGMYDGLMEAGR